MLKFQKLGIKELEKIYIYSNYINLNLFYNES